MTIYFHFNDYLSEHPLPSQRGRILGLDVGDKYVGTSLSDERAVIASPYDYYQRKSFQKDGAYFSKLMGDYKILFVIVGLPLNLNGSVSRKAEDIIGFIGRIQEVTRGDFIFWDERFSTLAVERAMLEHDISRKKRENNIDKLAATYILQGALDYLKNRQS